MWERCQSKERSALAELAAGKKPDELLTSRLESEGYVIRENNTRRLFSKLFGRFILLQGAPAKASSPSFLDVRITNVRGRYKVVPTALGRLLQDKDAEKSKRVMQAMLQMVKLDIQRLMDAYEGH